MKWNFIKKGLWVWRSADKGTSMAVLHFLEGKRFRFWTFRVLEFKVYFKTHDRALKGADIIRKHLIAARDELRDNGLNIPGNNMPWSLTYLSEHEIEKLEDEHPECFA